MSLNISDIWLTQRKIDETKVQTLLNDLKEWGGFRCKLLIRECEDGELELLDGHHRLMALWMFGKINLEKSEYILTLTDGSTNRMGKLNG